MGRAVPAAGGLIAEAISRAAKHLPPPDIHLDIPWFSQFDNGHGYKGGDSACFDAAKALARDGGSTVLGSNKRIQIGKSEDRNGRLTVDPKRAREGRAYIDAELEAGRPVMVGVSYADHNYNVDKLTDHFVTITGRQTGPDGRTRYTFHDPATSNPQKGMDTRPQNRFEVDPDTGSLVRPGSDQADFAVDSRYEVSMVRKNRESAN